MKTKIKHLEEDPPNPRVKLSDLSLLVLEAHEADYQKLWECFQYCCGDAVRVHHVTNLESARDKMKQQEFDLMVLDVSSAHAGGLDLFETISDLAMSIPIIVLGESEGAETAARYASSGAQDYIAKADVTKTDFTKTLTYAIERNKLTQQLRAHAEFKAQFLAQISHELRSPLNGMLGTVDLLKETNLDQDQTSFVNTITRAGDALLSIINDVLDLAKIEAREVFIETADFELEGMLMDVCKIFSVTAREKGIDLFVKELVQPDYMVHADQTRLRQVLMNLVSNAVKFTGQGHVSVTVLPKNGRLHFAVEDSGIGIDPAKIGMIFESFKQAESSISRRFGGTGLGLSISKTLVELMGGEIKVESTPGTGSKFSFWIPFEAVKTNPTPRTPKFSGRKYLILDDNPFELRHIASILEHEGASVDCFDSPSDAQIQMDRCDYDGYLVDCKMPGESGLEFIASQKFISRLSEKVILMMPAGGHRKDDVKRTVELNLAGYLIKPIERKDLCRAMTELEAKNQFLKAEPKKQECKLRILVADDSPDNQLLIEAYLCGTQARVEYANNGQEAVDKFSQGTFDLVLMDMQMPVMDGVEATRRIRQMEKEKQQAACQIFALSGNSDQQDRVRMHAAGCNDFLLKPLRRVVFSQALRRVAKGLKSKPEEAAVAAIDLGVVSELKSLSVGEFADFYPSQLSAFLEQSKKHLAALKQAITDENYEEIRSRGHSLKGSAATAGAIALSTGGARMEVFGKTKAPVEEILREFETLVRVLAEAEEFFLQDIAKFEQERVAS